MQVQKCGPRPGQPETISFPDAGKPTRRNEHLCIPFRVEGGGAAALGYAQSPARKRVVRWTGLQDPPSSRTTRATAVGQCCQGDNAGHAGKSGKAAQSLSLGRKCAWTQVGGEKREQAERA